MVVLELWGSFGWMLLLTLPVTHSGPDGSGSAVTQVSQLTTERLLPHICTIIYLDSLPPVHFLFLSLYNITANKLISLPTKMASSSVE